MKSVSSNRELKQRVGMNAADFVQDGMKVGIGTGSTVAFFIEELGRRVKSGLNILGVPTSYAARMLCLEHGIPVQDSMLSDRLDLAVDGADEIDPYLNAIKGGGAAHSCEKIIASMADEFILIADETKLVSSLCRKFPLPVEISPPALSFAKKQIRLLGGTAELRAQLARTPCDYRKRQFILDILFSILLRIWKGLTPNSKRFLALLETGLLGIAKKALIGFQDKVELLLPKG